MADWCSEEREDGITGVLIDITAEDPHDPAEAGDDRTHDLVEILRIERFGQGAVAGNVGEQRSDPSEVWRSVRSLRPKSSRDVRWQVAEGATRTLDRLGSRSTARAAVPAEDSALGIAT
ncbi:MAG: hypothetical protein NVS3B26_00030 [Mycobacteriales bacterium]